jgi:hypothetical protein
MLKYYNKADVVPFIKAAELMRQKYEDEQIDMFSCISVPGLAEQKLMKSRAKYTYFCLPQRKKNGLDFSILDIKMKQNIVGGNNKMHN